MIDTHKDSVTLSPEEEVLPQDVSQAGVGNKALREMMGIIDSPTATEETSEAAVIEDKSLYTVQELLSLAVFASSKQKPEYSGRFCSVCNATTAHFRPRGNTPDYAKTISWFCSTCFLPGGFVYETVKSLINRQGERPTK
jgi:hypothetical protein